MSKQSQPPKETIGSRIPPDWMHQVDEVCAEAGLTRSEWLLSIIGEALGKTDVNAVHGLIERVTALEKKLNRLAS